MYSQFDMINKNTIRKVSLFLCAYIMFCSCSHAQDASDETIYFKDVTASHMPLDSKAHALDVVLVDVNQDSHLDLILALESEPNRLYLNDGHGRFIWQKEVFVNRNHDTEHVRVGDFDKDGFVDVLFVAEDDQNHEFYLGNGDGTFRHASDRLLGKSEANGLDIGDVNGDGLLDIVIGNTGHQASNFLWLNNSASPGFFIDQSKKGLPAHQDQTQSIKLADLNGDGYLDIVVGNEKLPNRLYFNDGKGNFHERENSLPQTVLLHTREAIVSDVNGDGLPDILFANLTSNGGQWDKDPRARLFINRGEGNFEDETENRIPAFKFSTYAGNFFDYNRDGHQDIILSAITIPPFEAYKVQVLRNDGTGHFSFVTDDVIPDVTIGRSWGIAIGDVNGDGIDDVVIGGWGSQVRLLLAKDVGNK